MITYDLLIKNGIVIDGTGKKGEQFDIAINDGRIVKLDKDINRYNVRSAAHDDVTIQMVNKIECTHDIKYGYLHSYCRKQRCNQEQASD